MESSTVTMSRQRDDRPQESASSAPAVSQRGAGKMLDDRAYLAAFGRGGAQRMAIPLHRS